MSAWKPPLWRAALGRAHQDTPWTGVHDRWLRARHFTLPAPQPAFDIAYDTLPATVARRDRLDTAITVMAADTESTAVVTRLGCLRGIATLTAFRLAVEIGDRHRLDGRSIGRTREIGAHRVLLGQVAVPGVDHQDRERARPTVVGRGGLASPQALPGRDRPTPPRGLRMRGGARQWGNAGTGGCISGRRVSTRVTNGP